MSQVLINKEPLRSSLPLLQQTTRSFSFSLLLRLTYARGPPHFRRMYPDKWESRRARNRPAVYTPTTTEANEKRSRRLPGMKHEDEDRSERKEWSIKTELRVAVPFKSSPWMRRALTIPFLRLLPRCDLDDDLVDENSVATFVVEVTFSLTQRARTAPRFTRTHLLGTRGRMTVVGIRQEERTSSPLRFSPGDSGTIKFSLSLSRREETCETRTTCKRGNCRKKRGKKRGERRRKRRATLSPSAVLLGGQIRLETFV